MALSPLHLSLLEKPSKALQPTDFEEYFELKRLLSNITPAVRDDFTKRFARYYGLNAGGLTEAFKQKYFELFSRLTQAARATLILPFSWSFMISPGAKGTAAYRYPLCPSWSRFTTNPAQFMK